MRSPLAWVRDRVPVMALLTLPAAGELVAGVVHGGSLAWMIWWVTAAVVFQVGVALVLTETGWVRPDELLRVSVGTIRRRRVTFEQQAAVLQSLAEDLRRSSQLEVDRSARLFAELVRAEESARAFLAGELHDTVAQSLNAALVLLRLPRPELHREGTELLVDAEDQLRAVLARMRPPELVERGLAEAIADVCGGLRSRYGVDVEVTWSVGGEWTLPVPLAVLVYRVVQEALLNAVEHADGEGLRLRLEVLGPASGAQLLVEVTDGGPGFDPAAVRGERGRRMGLSLARERVALAGGSLLVDSAPGRGTRVVLVLPLAVKGVAPEQRTGLIGLTPVVSNGLVKTDKTTAQR